MNCQQVQAKFHQRLDERQSIQSDHQIIDHAKKCKICHERIALWLRIEESLLSDKTDSNQTPILQVPVKEQSLTTQTENEEGRGRRVRFASMSLCLATVATIALALVFVNNNNVIDESSVRSDLAVQSRAVHLEREQQDSSLSDPTKNWFGDAHTQHGLLAETMPTIRSLRDGVAPIGRNLLRAVTLLTTCSSEKTS